MLFSSLDDFVSAFLDHQVDHQADVAALVEQVSVRLECNFDCGLFVTADGYDGQLPAAFEVSVKAWY